MTDMVADLEGLSAQIEDEDMSREQAVDAYIVHEAHKNFAGNLGNKVTDVCVFDYWAE